MTEVVVGVKSGYDEIMDNDKEITNTICTWWLVPFI